MLRWLRNHGFAFTDRQKTARWDDLGGPTPFERWRHGSLRRYRATGVVLPTIVLAALALLPGSDGRWWQPSFVGLIGLFFIGMLFSRRDYDRWHARFERWRHQGQRQMDSAHSNT
ncbi:MAG TPA: hypothetical protein VGW38_00775 [Chloroflexota bacterium]|nr:hypothetical protein [Chloroflexota bacterium]